jgi:localization factor PodJL
MIRMRPGVPWNVKGIEAEAREVAQQAARRAGVSLGEWLSGLIMEGRAGPVGAYPQPQGQAYPQGEAVYAPQSQPQMPARAPVSAQAFTQGVAGRYPQALAQAYPEPQFSAQPLGQAQAVAYAPQPGSYPQVQPAVGDALARRLDVARPAVASPEPSVRPADIATLSDGLRELGDRIEQTEYRAQQAIQTVNQSVASMQERLDAAERVKQLADAAFTSAADALAQSARDQSKVFESLEASVRNVQQRLTDIEAGQAEWPGQESIGRLEVALDQLRDRIGHADAEREQLASQDTVHRLEAALQQLQKRLSDMEVAVGNTPDKDAIARLETSISSMRGDVMDADRRTREDMTHMAKYMRDLGLRVESAERNSLATEGLGARLDALDARSTSMFDELRGQMSGVDARLAQATSPQNTISPAAFAALKGSVEGIATRLDEMGSQSTQPLVQSISSIETKLGALASRIEEGDLRTMESVGGVNAVLRSLTSRLEDADKRQQQAIHALTKRMDESDDRADAGVRELNESLDRAMDDFGRRLEAAETSNRNAISAVRLTVDGLVAKAAEQAVPIESPSPRAKQAETALHALRQAMEAPAEPPAGLPPFLTGQAGTQVRDFPSDLPPFLDELAQETGARAGASQPDADAAMPESLRTAPDSGAGAAAPNDFLAQARRAAQVQAQAAAASSDARSAGRRDGAPASADQQVGGRNIGRLAVIGLASLALVVGLVFILMTMFGAEPATAPEGAGWQVDSDINSPEPKVLPLPEAKTPQAAVPDGGGVPGPYVEDDAGFAPLPETGETEGLTGDVTGEGLPGGLMQGTSALPEVSKKQTEVAILEAASVRGDPRAQFLLSLRYSEGRGVTKDDARAASLASKAAEQGFAVAQYRMGALHERGVGVEKSVPLAKAWYEKAAKQGNRKAMHNLAVLLADSTGGGQNFKDAARWFREGATYGLMDSQYNLAVLLEQGMGVERNLKEATTWYAIAAEQGDTGAAERLDALKKTLPASDVALALDAARKFKPRAVNAAANDTPTMP